MDIESTSTPVVEAKVSRDKTDTKPLTPPTSLPGVDFKAPLTNAKKKQRQKILIIAVALVVLPLIFHVAYRMWFYESTDDAYLKGHIHTISARVPGNVQQVLVVDNQVVKKGDVLVRLDHSDYELGIREAQANYSHAHKDVRRFDGYMNELGPTDRKVFDDYQANALVADARLNRAQLQYQYADVVAPADGKVGRLNVEVGDQIQAGQALMALVEPNPWIEANFKESQIAHLHPGQKVEVSIDTFSGHSFVGRVESIAPGSGSTFSLLPPDNATGNFTKVVQRIPVKIVLEPDSIKGYESRLVPGMSAEVSVRVE